MAVNVSLPTRNIDYSGFRPIPDKVRLTDFRLQAMYYKRFYLTMSHGPAFAGLYAAFKRAVLMELEEQ